MKKFLCLLALSLSFTPLWGCTGVDNTATPPDEIAPPPSTPPEGVATPRPAPDAPAP